MSVSNSMDYFTILNLDREPFSNSPDPDFFFQSRQHVDCLQKLELALRLKRGLNIVIGAVGAGKTTLCRTLLKKFSADNTIESHLILDPSFNSPLAFLENICTMIVGKDITGNVEHRFKEQIKHHLFQKGVDEEKTVILIIDEGQKLPLFCLEILREFLNYETNDHKLLQIVLFAQEEFQGILDRRANLADRVNLIHFLGPMSLDDTRQMISFRIKHASSQPLPPQLFTALALRAIYHATGGYPRKIINLCHQCMLALIVQNRTRVGWRLVRSCMDRSLIQTSRPHRKPRILVFSALVVFTVVGIFYIVSSGRIPPLFFSIDNQLTVVPEKAYPPLLNAAPVVMPDRHVKIKQPVASVPIAVSVQAADERVPASEKNVPEPLTAKTIPNSDMTVALEPVSKSVSLDRPTTDKEDVIKPPSPTLIGALTVRKNDTLGMMVKVIYGDFQSRYLKAVLDANPHIDHADAIRVGDTIAFPAIPAVFVQPSYPLWWLKVEEFDSLDTAYRRSIKASGKKGAPLMRMISEWDHRTGLKYGIYVSGHFFNPSAAENMIAKLPAELSGTAEIISGWPVQTILFSDPLLGKGY